MKVSQIYLRLEKWNKILAAMLAGIRSIWNRILSSGRTYWTVKAGECGIVQQHLNQTFNICGCRQYITCHFTY